jgi:thioredoxin 1
MSANEGACGAVSTDCARQTGVLDKYRAALIISSPRARAHPPACMDSRIKHVTDANFEQEVLQSDQPVLVDYWAEWCVPCKGFEPILDQVAREYEGRLKVAKLNVEENREIPPKYHVRGIPTLILFKNGAEVANKMGALSKSQLNAFIDSNL